MERILDRNHFMMVNIRQESPNRPEEQDRNISREDDEDSTAITFRENDNELSAEELQQEEPHIFGLHDGKYEKETKDDLTDVALMMLNENKFGLSFHNKSDQKFDIH